MQPVPRDVTTPPAPGTHGLSSDFLAPRPLSSCGATDTVSGPLGPAAPHAAAAPTPAHRVHGHEGGGVQRQHHGRPQLRQVVALHVHHRHPRRARHGRARSGPPPPRLPAACPPRAPHALLAPRPASPALALGPASPGPGGFFYRSKNPFSTEIWISFNRRLTRLALLGPSRAAARNGGRRGGLLLLPAC